MSCTHQDKILAETLLDGWEYDKYVEMLLGQREVEAMPEFIVNLVEQADIPVSWAVRLLNSGNYRQRFVASVAKDTEACHDVLANSSCLPPIAIEQLVSVIATYPKSSYNLLSRYYTALRHSNIYPTMILTDDQIARLFASAMSNKSVRYDVWDGRNFPIDMRQKALQLFLNNINPLDASIIILNNQNWRDDFSAQIQWKFVTAIAQDSFVASRSLILCSAWSDSEMDFLVRSIALPLHAYNTLAQLHTSLPLPLRDYLVSVISKSRRRSQDVLFASQIQLSAQQRLILENTVATKLPFTP